MRNHHPCNLPNREKGAVLLVSLMLLIVLTMLGVSATQTTNIETRMAHNMQEYVHAFEAAEVGIGIIRDYDLATFLEISATKGAKGTEEKPIEDTIVRSTDTNYALSYYTERVEGDFPDNSGRYGAGSARLAHYMSESKGRSTEEATAPEVTLKAGTAQPIPADNKVIRTNI